VGTYAGALVQPLRPTRQRGQYGSFVRLKDTRHLVVSHILGLLNTGGEKLSLKQTKKKYCTGFQDSSNTVDPPSSKMLKNMISSSRLKKYPCLD
jgi:hypothetical protein